MTTSVNQYQPVENGNVLDLPPIIRGRRIMPYWAHPQNQTLTETICRCFLFLRKKDAGIWGTL